MQISGFCKLDLGFLLNNKENNIMLSLLDPLLGPSYKLFEGCIGEGNFRLRVKNRASACSNKSEHVSSTSKE